MRALIIKGERDIEVADIARAAAARPPARSRCASAPWRSTTSTCGAGAAWPSCAASCPSSRARKAAGEVAAVGEGVTGLAPGDVVALYGAQTCGECPACREGRDNFCERADNIYGFHIDGFLREFMNLPARLAVKAPEGPRRHRRRRDAHHLRHGGAHVLRQRQAEGRRNSARACRRQRHRLGGDPARQGRGRAGHHHGRQRRKGRQGARTGRGRGRSTTARSASRAACAS